MLVPHFCPTVFAFDMGGQRGSALLGGIGRALAPPSSSERAGGFFLYFFPMILFRNHPASSAALREGLLIHPKIKSKADRLARGHCENPSKKQR